MTKVCNFAGSSALIFAGILLSNTISQAQNERICQSPDCLMVEQIHSARGEVKSIGILDTRLHLYIFVPPSTASFSLDIFDGDDDTPTPKSSNFTLYAPDGSEAKRLENLKNETWSEFPVETRGRWGVWRLSVAGPEDAENSPPARNFFMARTRGAVDLYLKPEPSARVRGLRLAQPHFGGDATHRFGLQTAPKTSIHLLLRGENGALSPQLRAANNTVLPLLRQPLLHDDRLKKGVTLETADALAPTSGAVELQMNDVRGEYGLGIEGENRLFFNPTRLMPMPRRVPISTLAAGKGAAARLDFDSPQTRNETGVAYTDIAGLAELALLPGATYRVRISRGFAYREREMALQTADLKLIVALEPRLEIPAGWHGGDAHCHTYFYDGTDSPAQMIEAGRAAGLDWMAVTEHAHSEQTERAQRARDEAVALSEPNRFIVFPGMETTGLRFHANVLGAIAAIPSGASLADVVAAARAKNSAEIPVTAVLNHPTNGKTAADEGRQSADLPLIELWNSNEPGATKLWWEMLNQGRRTRAITNSDSHNRKNRAPGFQRTYVFLGQKPPVAANIINALTAGNSVLSRGAFLDWTLGGERPGATIQRDKPLALRLSAQSALPIEAVEIVCNGEVVRRFEAGGKLQFSVSDTLPLQSGWFLVQVTTRGDKTPLAMSNPICVQGKL